MGDWSGTPPTILAGYVPSGDDLVAIVAELTAISAAWTSYTPTLTHITQGNGTLVAAYRRVGKTMDVRFKFTLGSTSSISTDPEFTLPYTTLASDFFVGQVLSSSVTLAHTGVAEYRGAVDLQASGVVRFVTFSGEAKASVTASVPFAWTTGDVIGCTIYGLELA